MLRGRLGFLILLGQVACGSSLPHPPYVPQATIALSPIETGPPPGRIERIPKRPAGADAWLDGEWIERHGRWFWLLGRWVKTPPGAKYAPWVVVRARDGTVYYAPSAWVDSRGAPLNAPAPIAFATASGEAIFDAEGQAENTGRSLTVAPERKPPAESPSRMRQ